MKTHLNNGSDELQAANESVEEVFFLDTPLDEDEGLVNDDRIFVAQ